MIKIKNFGTNMEADLAKSYLESFGIKCYAQEESLYPHLGVCLFIINPEELERAKELLKKYTGDLN